MPDARAEFKEKALPLLDELYGVALRMARNPQSAEDLVAETYARAWKNLDRFQAGTNIRAWLYRIMTNAFINEFRKKRREPEKVSMDAYDRVDDFHFFHKIASEASRAPDPVKDVVARLTNEDFQKALDALPEEYRAAVLLYDLQGLSYDETAQALEVPVGTVRSRLARGRRRMQESLFRHARDAGLVEVPS
ncbi:MAG: sigma-70 family RNA polymerase sigma factor [Elusimicrobia bacterium]|nr:sigma-70 family RNA polymerase sigma factor [Elusimicrobiota bacterium]MBK7207127.1 sigma-70 family RNA polymerase sigma factor [Elusimicrobiota bacterium]MBK7545933.1 sigma-70 family RNA polymerase sigma factor [Elusimicrobiota bacterium]MBK7574809.1 sigma-70 family RNA polymerase sigma factor [Elusimicrobiota bacterium]MBK7687540.1 sigma-70 family RNA polymerase sigma factor [Elusimicrobiota bacterium]